MIEAPHDHDHSHADTGTEVDPPESIRTIHATEDELASAIRTLMGRLAPMLAEILEEQRG